MKMNRSVSRLFLPSLIFAFIAISLIVFIRFDFFLNESLFISMRIREILSVMNYPMKYSLFEGIVLFSPLIILAFVLSLNYCIVNLSLGLFLSRAFSAVLLIASLYLFCVSIPSLNNNSQTVKKEELCENDFYFAADSLLEIIQLSERAALSEDVYDSYYLLYENNANLALNIKPKIKESELPWLWSALGVRGEYFFITGEIFINSDIPRYMKPFVAAHEISHYTGASSEAIANFEATVITVNSPYCEIKRSGAISALEYLLADLYTVNPEKYESVILKLSERTRADIALGREFYQKNSKSRLFSIAKTLNKAHTELYGDSEIRDYSALSYYLAEYFKYNH